MPLKSCGKDSGFRQKTGCDHFLCDLRSQNPKDKMGLMAASITLAAMNIWEVTGADRLVQSSSQKLWRNAIQHCSSLLQDTAGGSWDRHPDLKQEASSNGPGLSADLCPQLSCLQNESFNPQPTLTLTTQDCWSPASFLLLSQFPASVQPCSFPFWEGNALCTA